MAITLYQSLCNEVRGMELEVKVAQELHTQEPTNKDWPRAIKTSKRRLAAAIKRRDNYRPYQG